VPILEFLYAAKYRVTYVADTDFQRILRIGADGNLSLFLDTNVVNGPSSLTLDAQGNL
jgi:hypothetical protein